MQIPPNLYLSLAIQNYTMPKIEDITPYVFYICLLENHLVDPRDIISLCQLFNNDIRKIINQLQFRLLKLNNKTEKVQSKQIEMKEEKNDEIIIIDLEGEDDPSNDKKNLKNKSICNEIIMEHLSLDKIIGIDLNLINIFNYYLRHCTRPDLALVHTVPDYVFLSKYEQLQYQLKEMNKDENQLYYYSLNKLYETEVQQSTNLNNNYNIDIFDEWSIHERGGILVWLIQYKNSFQKTIKNDKNPFNDLPTSSSSIKSLPELKSQSDFTTKSK